MKCDRRAVLLLCVGALWVTACGGTLSTLRKMGPPKGNGPARVELLNTSGATIGRAYVALTRDVDRASAAKVQPGSAEDIELWGEDLLGRESLLDGSAVELITLQPDRYDVLLLAADRREQLVKGLKLQPGQRYVLEVGSAWRIGR